MKKRLLKVAVTAALAVSFAAPAFAANVNPFTDLPAKHWAYDAVTKLAQAGVIDGYADKTFKGDKTVTRYEMAQIVAKAMSKSVNPEQKAMVDKLAAEFSSELNTLGVKVEGMQSQLDNMVKISGDARVRYENTQDTLEGTDFRARLTFDGKINNNIKFNARLTSNNIAYNQNGAVNAQVDTANATFHALGLTNTIGRQDIKLGSGFMADTQFDGIKTTVGNFKVFAGNMKTQEKLYAGEYTAKILGANVTADYVDNKTTNNKYYGVNAGFGLFDGVAGNVEYVKNDTTGDAAKAYGVKFTKLGLSATYRDVQGSAYTGYATMASDLNPIAGGTSFKGMEYQYDKALDKNTALVVKYQDFDNMKARTAATVNVKF
jgi:hypothetical protein